MKSRSTWAAGLSSVSVAFWKAVLSFGSTRKLKLSSFGCWLSRGMVKLEKLLCMYIIYLQFPRQGPAPRRLPGGLMPGSMTKLALAGPHERRQLCPNGLCIEATALSHAPWSSVVSGAAPGYRDRDPAATLRAEELRERRRRCLGPVSCRLPGSPDRSCVSVRR